MTTRIGSLCSGAGGLDLAVEAVFGAETVWHCEIDDAASKVLAHRWPGVPNHRDLISTDWAAVEPIDILCAGWPCQPFSLAGKRKGADDERAIWPHIAGAVRVLRPRIVILENVTAVLAVEFGRVADSLAALGYDLRWTSLRASEVGAPHRRERLFVVASDTGGDRFGGDAQCHSGSQRSELKTSQRDDTDRRRGNAADTTRYRRHEGWPEPARFVGGSDAPVSGDGAVDGQGVGNDQSQGAETSSGPQLCAGSGDHLLPTPAAARSGRNQSPSPGAAVRPSLDSVTDLFPTPSAADAGGGHISRSGDRRNELLLPGIVRELLPTPTTQDGANCGGPAQHRRNTKPLNAVTDWGRYTPAIRRWETATRPAPSPTEPNSKGNPRLAPAFSEWLMGWPAGWVTEVQGISRNDQLRIIGNGVVPQQAIAALRWLLNVSEVAA